VGKGLHYTQGALEHTLKKRCGGVVLGGGVGGVVFWGGGFGCWVFLVVCGLGGFWVWGDGEKGSFG